MRNLSQPMRKSLAAMALTFSATLLFAQPANATTGDGCYVIVNVAQEDALNVRAEPSARSNIVGKIYLPASPIISGGTSAADAEEACLPRHRVLESRWCPVNVVFSEVIVIGWIKRRYLAQNDCP